MLVTGFPAFGSYAEFAGCFALEQHQRHPTHPGQILGCIVGSDPAGIFVEAHVQRPVQFILNPPVVANQRGYLLGTSRKT